MIDRIRFAARQTPMDDSAARPAAASALPARLRWDAGSGAIMDGPRRYLMMRPDVLMGMLRRLPDAARAQALDAFAESVSAHGIDSIRAYFRQVGEDPPALLAATAQAAADLGWGVWSFEPGLRRLGLSVADSPFAQGAGPSPTPVCAPIRGMLQAVASVATGVECEAVELRCVACGADRCEFEARWAAC
jgi:hypothetical protein